MPSVTAGGGFGEGAGGPLVVLDRGQGVNGELVLRTDGADLEVIANGVFLMDTRLTVSERLMVSATLARVRPGARLLVGGLGVGASVVQALESGVGRVDVVEVEALVVRWWERYFRAHWGLSGRDLDRLRVIRADVWEHLSTTQETYDAIVLDTDNGPEWLVHERNAGLYAVPALLVAARRLAPGGSCVYWSASPSDAFEGRLRQVYADIERVDVGRFDVGRADASPDVLYACRRPLDRSPGDR